MSKAMAEVMTNTPEKYNAVLSILGDTYVFLTYGPITQTSIVGLSYRGTYVSVLNGNGCVSVVILPTVLGEVDHFEVEAIYSDGEGRYIKDFFYNELAEGIIIHLEDMTGMVLRPE